MEGVGVDTIAVDALDRPAFVAAVHAARADAAVHLLTAIPHHPDPRKFDKQMALTNRLRVEGTRSLLEGCRAAGTTRIVGEGLALAYRPTDGPVKDEAAPLWTDGPRQFRRAAGALVELEQMIVDAGGAVLRYGHLYGDGTAYAADGDSGTRVRERKLPIVGDGGAIYSFLHAFDAATATLAALESAVSGVFNAVDDDPAPVREWLPYFAASLGAPPPRRVPALLARVAVGEWGVAFMTRLRGASNARLKQTLGWKPSRPSWRESFVSELRKLPI
jgi:nucleoside-diphosphate-sugar epimerase